MGKEVNFGSAKEAQMAAKRSSVRGSKKVGEKKAGIAKSRKRHAIPVSHQPPAVEAPVVPETPVLQVEEPVAVAPQAPKKKVILVDGPSFYHPSQRRVLGWGQIRWSAVASILMREIGEGEVAGRPVYTVPPDLAEGLQKSIGVGGFQVDPVDPAFEGDDRHLIKMIKSLDPNEIGVLVLVTYDGSFVDAAREAKKKGIKVIWVASVHPTNRVGNPIMGVETQAVVKSEFEFVDLLDSGIAGRVRIKGWEDNYVSRRQAESVPIRPVEEKKIRVSFGAEVSPRDHTLFMTMIRPVLDRFNCRITATS